MKRVITYGTFDVLHYGHINLLKRAKALGDYLIVGLSSDEFNAIKNKKSYYTYEQRKTILEACRYVDLVIPENSWEQKIDDVKKYQADTFVMGDDWQGKFDFLKDYCEVVYLPRTPDVSSTETKRYLTIDRVFGEKEISKNSTPHKRLSDDEIERILTPYVEPVYNQLTNELNNIKDHFLDENPWPIFTMWWQDNSPELVQMCIASIKRFYPELIVIKEKNILDYLEIPDYIWTKFKNGIISPTHFSDYIRCALLDKYGGIWIDSTYYMIAPIPSYILKATSFVLKNNKLNKISNNFLKFKKNNRLIKTMRIFLERYWAKEDSLVDYFFFHVYFMLAVKKDPQCMKIFENIPYMLNENPQFLLKIFSQNFDEDVLKYVRQTSFMYKLTYKDKKAEENLDSWYWFLINKYREGELLSTALEYSPY